jgi:coenzyme F420 hydrogenase subunit beta
MTGVVHAGVESQPLSSNTKFSKTRDELLAATGSRYAPASPCDGLKRADDQGQWVFIGKPCDAAGVRKAQQSGNGQIKDVGVVISIFCAGTPSTQGTLDLLSNMDVQTDKVSSLRYRGNGWPGKFCVSISEAGDTKKELTYREAWGFLQKYRPYRCYLCPDGTGEFADIACGDPWYRDIKEDEAGYSLILVRTERGRQILQNAITAGFIKAERAAPEILEKSQVNLFGKRAAVWGRILAFKLFGLPAPRYVGFTLFRHWLTLPPQEMARSIFGTMRRIVRRQYYKPQRFAHVAMGTGSNHDP